MKSSHVKKSNVWRLHLGVIELKSAVRGVCIRMTLILIFWFCYKWGKHESSSNHAISKEAWRKKVKNLSLVEVNEERIKLGLSSLNLQFLNYPVKWCKNDLIDIMIDLIEIDFQEYHNKKLHYCQNTYPFHGGCSMALIADVVYMHTRNMPFVSEVRGRNVTIEESLR